MKNLHSRLIAFILVCFLVLTSGVYAADALYRFMHNDHDALIIGEIASIEGDNTIVRVEKSIISAKDLNVNASKKQLKLSEAKIISPFGYSFFYNEDGSSMIEPSVGDYVLVSLMKSGSGFKVAWGAYKVDSLDYRSLSVVLPEEPSIWSRMDAAAIKAFINSDGKITEFSFDGDAKIVRSGENIIFDGSKEDATDAISEDPVNTYKEEDKNESKSSAGIIGGADGPTAIFISGNPLTTLIIPIAAAAVIIFAAGFAAGYLVRKRRK